MTVKDLQFYFLNFPEDMKVVHSEHTLDYHEGMVSKMVEFTPEDIEKHYMNNELVLHLGEL